MLDSYIRQEKDYLERESKKFVEEFPQVSQFLSSPYFDPDINRTLDGFTYLSSLLNAKLHREYPQLTANLMDMLWPNYLQQTPSATVIEFTNPTTTSVLVHTQASVHSAPSAHCPIACTFNTIRDTWVTPFAITRLSAPSLQTIEVDFYSDKPINLEAAGIHHLRLFLGADTLSSFPLYLYFSEYLSSVTLVIDQQEIALSDLTLTPAGFDTSHATFVYPDNTFSGYRLLHEYFSFTENFLFFDLSGFPDYLNRLNSNIFTLKFQFKRPLPHTLKLTNSSIKVNCVPAINLFFYDCEPICLSGHKTAYPLYINHQNNDCYELFAIENVTGWVNNQPRKYAAFNSFIHQSHYEAGETPLYYHLNRHSTAENEKIHYALSFVRGDEDTLYKTDEIISIRALCSNQDKAQNLRVGDICRSGDNVPPSLSLTNITYPSAVTRPNLNNGLQWTTISSLSLNYLSLLNRDSLCQILQNYNFTAGIHQRADKSLSKLLDSIQQFTSTPHQQYYNDLIVEGHKSTIHVSPAAFNNEGEMYLFGAVIAHFYSQYTTVNSFHFLELVNSSTHEVYQWSLMNV